MGLRLRLGGRFGGKLRWIPAGAIVAAGAVLAGTVLASAAAPALPRRSPAQLLAGLRQAVVPRAMSAVVVQSANFGFPALPDIGGFSSSVLSAASLVSGTHTVEIWYSGPGHVRIALPVPFGETDLRVNGDQVWLWNSRGQTATHYILPSLAGLHGIGPSGPRRAGMLSWRLSRLAGPHHVGFSGPALTPVQVADRLLAMVGPTTKVTVDGTVTVAGRPAYQLAISPRTSQSLIGQILIAVDAKSHLPLRVQVFARGSSGAAFQVGFTSLTPGIPAGSNFTFTPPAGAHVKTVRLSLGAVAGMPALPKLRALPGMPMPPGPPGALRHGVHIVPPNREMIAGRAHAPGALAGARVLGSGWLAVAVIPAGRALAILATGGSNGAGHRVAGQRVIPGTAGPGAGGPGTAAPGAGGPFADGQPGGQPGLGAQVIALLRLLLNAAAPVHGSWGSGRLLRTSLFSVLITSKGQVLVGAVAPAVLYADAAKVK